MNLFILNVNGALQTCYESKDIPLIANTLGASPKFVVDALEQAQSFERDPLSNSKMLIGGRETYRMFKLSEINQERFERFMEVYFNELEANFDRTTYTQPLNHTFQVMVEAVARNNFGKDTVSFKNTCKVLKIKHTYKDIKAFLSEQN